MTETGLLIALVAFLLLLFGFIWLVVRSSLRGLDRQSSAAPKREVPRVERESPDAPADPEPPTETGKPEPAAAAAAPAVVETASPADPPAPPPVAPPEEHAVSGGGEESNSDGTGAFDLSKDVTPRLIVEQGTGLTVGHEVPLDGGLTIGRAGGSDLQLGDEFTSHTHASIVRRGQFYFITDLGSTNGTFLNDRRVTEDSQLRVRDVLRFGDTRLRYEE